MIAQVSAGFDYETLVQQILIGLTNGSVFAIIALGYTMVYGIVELINFAHGDLFMLGSFLALTLVGALGLVGAGTGATIAGLALILVLCMIFCASLNWTVDRVVYKPLRKAPKLAPLVSAIGVSFIFMNLGMFWGAIPMDLFAGGGAAGKHFPNLVPNTVLFEHGAIRFTLPDLIVILLTVPLMIGLTLFVKYTKLGKAMRATAQNPVAAQLMGINTDRVIGATFLIGGALAGAASVIYGLYIHSIRFDMGYQNGLYAFTAAVVGGIGNIPGAVLGGLLIGVVRALSDQYVGAQWQAAVVFGILILILVFKPTGLLGSRVREKV